MMRFRIALLVLFAAVNAHGAEDNALVAWNEVKQKIAAHWQLVAPNERVLSIQSKGAPQHSSSQRATNSAFIGSSWYSAWVTSYRTIQGSFARQVALVSVERSNKSKARFEVAALYRGVGERWQFDKIAVGPVTELGVAGDPVQPRTAKALAIFGDAWKSQRPDFDVRSMKLLSEPKPGGTPARRFIRYRLEVLAIGTGDASEKYRGNSVVCRPADYSSTLKWEQKSGAWRADESMIRDLNEDRDCDL
ncbi:MAG: hypothetical protein ACI9DC_000501 [Gammaproteobacteria bacterium]|jgi:hypothetical protein